MEKEGVKEFDRQTAKGRTVHRRPNEPAADARGRTSNCRRADCSPSRCTGCVAKEGVWWMKLRERARSRRLTENGTIKTEHLQLATQKKKFENEKSMF